MNESSETHDISGFSADDSTIEIARPEGVTDEWWQDFRAGARRLFTDGLRLIEQERS